MPILPGVFASSKRTTVAATYFLGTLATTTSDLGLAIGSDSSNNTYFFDYVFVSPNYGLGLSKYNSAGTLQWSRKLGGNASTANVTYSYQGGAADSSGNVYVVGSSGGTSKFGILAKYNTSGTIQWQRQITNPGGSTLNINFAGVTADASGNVYISGQFYVSASNYSTAVSKYNSSGTIQWNTILPYAVSNNYTALVAVDGSGNVYVLSNAASTSIYLVKLNSSGVIQWQTSIVAGGGSILAYGLAADSSGNVYVTGYQSLAPQATFVQKYNTSGTLQWQRQLSGAGTTYNVIGYGISVDSSGNVYVSCQTSPSSGAYSNTAFIKYNSSGTLQWQRQLTNSTSTVTATIYGSSLDASGNLLFAGTSAANATSTGFFGKLPADGTKTGTYSLNGASYVYSAGTLTDAAASYTNTTTAITATSNGVTDAAGALTDAAMTLTSNVTVI